MFIGFGNKKGINDLENSSFYGIIGKDVKLKLMKKVIGMSN